MTYNFLSSINNSIYLLWVFTSSTGNQTQVSRLLGMHSISDHISSLFFLSDADAQIVQLFNNSQFLD